MLDSRWVESLHARLTVRYGAAWLRLWQDVPVEALRADWAEVLSGITPEAIRYALGHLPEDAPPNATQFRALCLRYSPTVVALPAPKQDPNVARVALAAIQRPADYHPKAWAYDLREREQRGDRLSSVQRSFWREALRHELGAEVTA